MENELQEHKENCIKTIILSKEKLEKWLVSNNSLEVTVDWIKRLVQSLFDNYFVFMDKKIKVDNFWSISIDISEIENSKIEKDIKQIVKENMILFDEVLYPKAA